MQKLPEAPESKGVTHTQKDTLLAKKKKKKRNPFLSAVITDVTTLKSFLLLVGDPTRPSKDGCIG